MSGISVVIPVKDGEDKISQCLEAVFNQTIKPFEVIVVDGHSRDKTVDIASRFPVRVLYENYGTVGGGRQVGTNSAKGDFVAFTDVDCIPARNWLEYLIKEFDEGIIGVGGGIKNIGDGLWNNSIALALDSFLGSANSVQDRLLKEKRFVRSISGCNSMYKRTELIAVGGFNVHFSVNEDTEINKRLANFGNLLYTPHAIVFHNQDRDLVEFTRRIYSFGFGRGVHQLFDLHVLPPILGLITLSFLFVNRDLFIFMIALYVTILVCYDLLIFSKSKNPKYLISIPIIFVLEHVSYAIGFWVGLLKSL